MANAPFFADRETIRLTRQGIWLSDGTEIDHEPTRRLFARSLFHDEQGYWLRIGPESKLIEVEDTAYFVTRLEGSARAGYRVFLNDETAEALDPATIRYRPGRLTCRVHRAQEEAKFLSTPYMELLGGLEEDARGYYVTIAGQRVELERFT